mgnify:CR=1 FL=1
MSRTKITIPTSSTAVCATTGLLDMLTRQEVRGVMAHELAHPQVAAHLPGHAAARHAPEAVAFVDRDVGPPGDDVQAAVFLRQQGADQRRADAPSAMAGRHDQRPELTRAVAVQAHLPQALPVNVENHVNARRAARLGHIPRRAVMAAEDLGMFEKAARVHPLGEGLGADEVIVLARNLTGAWGAAVGVAATRHRFTRRSAGAGEIEGAPA